MGFAPSAPKPSGAQQDKTFTRRVSTVDTLRYAVELIQWQSTTCTAQDGIGVGRYVDAGDGSNPSDSTRRAPFEGAARIARHPAAKVLDAAATSYCLTNTDNGVAAYIMQKAPPSGRALNYRPLIWLRSAARKASVSSSDSGLFRSSGIYSSISPG